VRVQDWEREEGDEENGAEEEEEGGLTAGEKARMSLSRNRRTLGDEDAEVIVLQHVPLFVCVHVCLCAYVHMSICPCNQRGGNEDAKTVFLTKHLFLCVSTCVFVFIMFTCANKYRNK
jgi:hypothetical protein